MSHPDAGVGRALALETDQKWVTQTLAFLLHWRTQPGIPFWLYPYDDVGVLITYRLKVHKVEYTVSVK
jgi:hypothetical protein